MARRDVDDGVSEGVVHAAGRDAADLARAPGRWWWVSPLAVYTLTRLINVAMFVVASRSAISVDAFIQAGHAHYRTTAGTAPPGYLTSVTNWDGQWYWEIAANGYPSQLPVDSAGDVAQNPWAFFPLYPYAVRGLVWLTGLDFPVVASAVSVVLGALAMLVLHRLVARRYGQLSGTLAVLAVSTFICAPVFLMAYAESFALLLLLTFFWAVLGRRYWWAGMVLVLLAFTRGITAPLAPALLLYAALEWRRGRLERSSGIALIALAAWAGMLTFAWFVVAGLSTGRWDAYVATQKAWNPELTVVPVVRFIERNSDVPGGPLGAALIAVAWAVLLIWLLTKGQDERLLACWTACYVAYLLAVTDWNWSNVRYYLLALPIFWPTVKPTPGEHTPLSRVLVASAAGLAGIAMQWWHIRYCVTISAESVQVP